MSSLLLGVIRRRGGVGTSVGVRSLASIPSLPPAVAEFVRGAAEECKPANVHVVTGTQAETANILAGLEKEGMVKRLPKYENCWLARTDPKDVARVESKTVIVTKKQRDTIPIPSGGAKSQLGSWMSEADWQKAREERFPGCRTPGRSSRSAAATEETPSWGRSASPCASPPESPRTRAGWPNTCWIA